MKKHREERHRPAGDERPARPEEGGVPAPEAREPQSGTPSPEEAPTPGESRLDREPPPDPAPRPAETLAKEAEQLKDRWLRAEADLQNFRRRAARDREEAVRAAEESVLLELVAVADDLERALRNLPEDARREAWAEGVELVIRRIRDYLSRQGIEAVDPLGQRFDPAFHEALLEREAGERFAPGTVAEVVLKGYRRGDRALRAARVVVAARPREDQEHGSGQG